MNISAVSTYQTMTSVDRVNFDLPGLISVVIQLYLCWYYYDSEVTVYDMDANGVCVRFNQQVCL